MEAPEQACSLHYWIGKDVWAFVPMLNLDGPAWMTVRGVEHGGIWLEAEKLTVGRVRGTGDRDQFDDTHHVTAFVPFSQIMFICIFTSKDTQGPRLLSFSGTSAPPPAA